MAEIVKLNPLAAAPALNVKSDMRHGPKSLPSLEIWKPWNEEPLPADITAASLDEIDRFLADQLRPIEPVELATRIEALRAHYGEWADLEKGLAKRLNTEWLEDFEGYPAALFVEACRRWRNSAAKAPPTPGQLKSIVEGDEKRLRHLGWQAMKARKALR